MKWELRIRKAENGFILESDIDEGLGVTEMLLEDDENDELKSGESLLWQVIEFFGLRTSRYAKEVLTITREQGDKYEPEEENGTSVNIQ